MTNAQKPYAGAGPVEGMVRPVAEARQFDLPGMRRMAVLLSPFAAQALLECADEIERLRRVLAVVRQYPDFDEGGPLAEVMDQALAGQHPLLLELLEKLAACGAVGPNVRAKAGQTARAGLDVAHRNTPAV